MKNLLNKHLTGKTELKFYLSGEFITTYPFTPDICKIAAVFAKMILVKMIIVILLIVLAMQTMFIMSSALRIVLNSKTLGAQIVDMIGVNNI